MSSEVQLSGNEMLNKKVLSSWQKVRNDEAVRRDTGRVSHAGTVATGNARSPRLDRLVASTNKFDIEPDLRWRHASITNVKCSVVNAVCRVGTMIRAHSLISTREFGSAVSTLKSLDTKPLLRDNTDLLTVLGESHFYNGDLTSARATLQRVAFVHFLWKGQKNLPVIIFLDVFLHISAQIWITWAKLGR